jgi:hypothetical protein
MAHKGQRTNKHREAEHPCVVDIPIRPGGLGQNIDLIERAVKAAPGGGERWGYRTWDERFNPSEWCRIGLKRPEDADAIAARFAHIGARRVR